MFAPEPDEPVFIVGRLIVSEDEPRFFAFCLLRAVFSTFLAVLVGGGGGAGGGTGSGIFGELHIVKPWLGYFRFGFYFVL